jgi:hypothetical protein
MFTIPLEYTSLNRTCGKKEHKIDVSLVAFVLVVANVRMYSYEDGGQEHKLMQVTKSLEHSGNGQGWSKVHVTYMR